MRLGISSYAYTWAIGVPGHPPERPLGFIGLLHKAAELGVRLVQVADNLPLAELPPAEFEAFERRARELGLDIEVGTRGIRPANLGAYLRIAQRLGSPILRVVIDSPGHEPHEDEVVDILRAALPDFERARVCLAIENHDRFAAKVLARIVKRLGSDYVGICLDTVNSFGALEGPQVVVDTLGPWVVNLHIKDFVVQRVSHKMGFVVEGRPAGEGQLDVPWLLGALSAMGRDPNAILELWTPPQATLAETIALEDAWARRSVATLRRYISQ